LRLFSSFPDPFAVGGGDLNPLGRGLGGGGMLMDPRHMGRQPPLGIPGNLPPGILIWIYKKKIHASYYIFQNRPCVGVLFRIIRSRPTWCAIRPFWPDSKYSSR
jgi:hypothetical protein